MANYDGRRAARRVWKAAVFKPNAESPAAKREAEIPKVAEHVRQRLEKVRQLVLLHTEVDKKKQHARLVRRSLRSRLQRGEITRTAYENEAKDAGDTLSTLQEKLKALKASVR